MRTRSGSFRVDREVGWFAADAVRQPRAVRRNVAATDGVHVELVRRTCNTRQNAKQRWLPRDGPDSTGGIW